MDARIFIACIQLKNQGIDKFYLKGAAFHPCESNCRSLACLAHSDHPPYEIQGSISISSPGSYEFLGESFHFFCLVHTSV